MDWVSYIEWVACINRGDVEMSNVGFLITFFIVILLVIIFALIAVVGAVSGAVAGIVDEEDEAEE